MKSGDRSTMGEEAVELQARKWLANSMTIRPGRAKSDRDGGKSHSTFIKQKQSTWVMT